VNQLTSVSPTHRQNSTIFKNFPVARWKFASFFVNWPKEAVNSKLSATSVHSLN